ncbi:MAG: GNAT family N-acetyltransferase [Arcobacteraceae bacterium]
MSCSTNTNTNYELIEKAIKYIDENFKDQPSVDEIAKNIGMSKYHFIRVFKEYAGVTPKQFLHSITLNYAKEHIKQSKSILDSSLDIGLSSSSRLHELFVNLIGVTPKEWREKGKDVLISFGYGDTPFGEALIAYTEKGICYLGFIDNNKEIIFSRFKELWENASFVHDDKKANEYLENIFIKNKKYNLLVKGTNFQVNVWKALLNLPNGVVTTYQDMANFIDKPKSVRAVASAIGKNHVGYLIPCHRVIAKSGAMSGYRWGIERKKVLIAYESVSKLNAIIYREATTNDIPKLCQLLHQLFSQETEFTPDMICQTRALKQIIENDEIGKIYIASKEDEIVGMVNILYTVSTALGERVAMLEDMIIDKNYRGENIGSALLEYAITKSKEQGVKRITLLTDSDNFSAHRFYENMGFSQSAMIPFRIQL